ncbi:MAG: type III-B CRISPR module-associated protein Cmr5 [Acidobacteria bacterium]|nr:type III-B CRISPR module-associated protein Cmr5 [Acidobacteriota bacterium]
MKTRDQRYAETIFDQVSNFRKLHLDKDGNPISSKVKPYGSMAHKLPVLIRSAGLAQALAFVEARGKDTQKELLRHLEFTLFESKTEPNHLLSKSRSAQLGEYMQLTQNALSASVWYKRFAQSVLGVDPGDDDDAEGGQP